ncbi:Holliday junction branch migration DNA helicase RuvB [Patescibacteria group bacterium]|nr:Holliday junction branch migration DNA helicase RuvB [Patescibacteria group bacterium]MBU4023072.1 Holliday junction branch migration DNA helicase RuvB [Patescibacteria group bacterium]
MSVNPEIQNPPIADNNERILDTTLRPQQWCDFVGQKKTKNNIRIMIEGAKKRNEAVDHILFCGGPGLGKTTLSHLVAQENDGTIKTISGPSLQRPGDLAAILTSLSDKDVLFIDEIHRMNKICEEMIYPALEGFKLNILTGTGPMARSIELDLPKFTLIGATTKIGLLTSPLRTRFGAIFQINLYHPEEIEEIIIRSAKLLGTDIEEEAIKKIGQCSRFTPRIANRLLKRIRDFAQVEGKGAIDMEITNLALKEMEVDELGLEPQDRKILKTIIEKFGGGPVGIQALAAAVGEDQNNILEVYEPYLLQLGLIDRTPQGRIITEKTYKHLKDTKYEA